MNVKTNRKKHRVLSLRMGKGNYAQKAPKQKNETPK